MSTTKELHAYAKKARLRKLAEDRYTKLDEKMTENFAKPTDKEVAEYEALAEYANKKLLYERIKPFSEIDLYKWDEDDDPDEFEESVIIVEKAMNKVANSVVHKMLKESGIDSYDIAKRVYKLASQKGETNKIPLGTLITSIETVTNAVVKLGRKEKTRRQPFFF